MNLADELAKLENLRQSGALTEADASVVQAVLPATVTLSK